MKNRGVNEAFTEAARVALQVKNVKGDKADGCCSVMCILLRSLRAERDMVNRA